MKFDWRQFLSRHYIEYVESSPFELRVRCPLCGSHDSGAVPNMSINTEGHGWKCWGKPREHKGVSPVRLIMLLTRCSWEQAQAASGYTGLPTSDLGLLAMVRSKIAPEPVTVQPMRKLALPESFKPIDNPKPSARPYQEYLRSPERQFSIWDIQVLARKYEVGYCTRGDFKGRVIFPVRFDGRLIAWTGRSIFKGHRLRYRTTSREDTGTAIQNYLLWWDHLIKGSGTIFLCEGPMDAAKIVTLAHNRCTDMFATCFFTSTASPAQIDLLHELLPRFVRRFLLLDRETTANTIHLQSQLTSLGVRSRYLPPQFKDPGELTDIRQLEMITNNKSVA